MHYTRSIVTAVLLIAGGTDCLFAAPGPDDLLGPKSEVTEADRKALKNLEELVTKGREKADVESFGTLEFRGAIQAARRNFPVFPVGVASGKPIWRKHLLNTRPVPFDAFRFITPTRAEDQDLFWLFAMPDGKPTVSWHFVAAEGEAVPFGTYGKCHGLSLEDTPLISHNIVRFQPVLGGQFKPGKEYICYFFFSENIPVPIQSAMVVLPEGTPDGLLVSTFRSVLALKPKGLRSQTWLGMDKEVQAAIAADPKLLAQPDEDGDLPIHWAALDSNLGLLEFLIQKGADVNAQGEGGWTPLHFASQHGHEETARILIARGANINACSKYGATPLFEAARRKELALVRLLVESKAEVNLATFANEPPLHAGMGKDGDEITRYLIDHGARVTFRDVTGDRCIHRAAVYNCPEQAKMLLDRHVDIECLDALNRTPLMRSFGPPVAQCLLERGANLHARTSQGRTALHFAVEQGRVELAELLLERGIKVDAEGGGLTALHLAAARGDVPTCTLLLKFRADPSALNSDGSTALDLARESGHTAVVELLKAQVAK